MSTAAKLQKTVREAEARWQKARDHFSVANKALFEFDQRCSEASNEMYEVLIELVASSDAYDETEAAENRCHTAIELARAAIAKVATP